MSDAHNDFLVERAFTDSDEEAMANVRQKYASDFAEMIDGIISEKPGEDK